MNRKNVTKHKGKTPRKANPQKVSRDSAPSGSNKLHKMQFKGSWNEVKAKLKQRYPQLTDDDLAYSEGKDDELIGRLHKRLGRAPEYWKNDLDLGVELSEPAPTGKIGGKIIKKP
jgi:uncharacterized protein YjbJ (UPF0337 family)